MGPAGTQGGTQPPPCACVLHDRGSQAPAGWQGLWPLSLGMTKRQAGPDHRLHPWILLLHLLGGYGDLRDQLPTLVLCSFCLIQLVSSLGQDGCGRRTKTVGIL